MRDVVFIDGCRTPFLRSGGAFQDQLAYDLARSALSGLLTRTHLDPGEVDRVVLGCVIQDVETSNVAREASLAAGFPFDVPAFTVTMACISANQAISTAFDLIRTGQAETIVAGGTEALSDIPIRIKRSLRKKILQARKYKAPADYVKFFRGISPSDFLPRVPSVSEFSTGETMGESADKLAATFGIDRHAQDEYALLSHQRAADARERGILSEEIVPVVPPPNFDPVSQDDGIRPDTSMEKLSALPPAFVKPFGTVTAGNASFLTDGASAVLLMEKEAAVKRGFEPRARLRDYTVVAQDPGEELLLGPAYAIPRLLERNGLTLADIDVFEIHEAFAAPVLAVLAALRSASFAREKLERDQPLGEIPMDKLNVHGGSLSLGHPFGATGGRLVTTAVNRLLREDGTLALVAACAAGGLGHALLIERFSPSTNQNG